MKPARHLHAVDDDHPPSTRRRNPDGIGRHKRADGSTAYVVRWHEGGRKLKATFDTLKAARDFKASRREAKRLGLKMVDRRVTLGEHLEKWWKLRVRQLEQRTKSTYRPSVVKRLLPYGADVRLMDIDREWLDEFVGWMFEAGDHRVCRRHADDGFVPCLDPETCERDDCKRYTALEQVPIDHPARKPLGIHAINDTMSLLGSALDVAVEWGKIGVNPAAKYPEVDEPSHEAIILEPHEVFAIADAAKLERDRCMIILAAFSGLRASELRMLSWRRVDLAKRRIYLREAANADGTPKPPKNRHDRDVPLLDEAIEALERWRQHAPSTRADALLFTNRAGKMVDWSRYHRDVWGPLRRRLEARIERFHDLRHTFVSLVAEAGVPKHRAMQWSGHKSEASYDIYRHLFERGEQEAVDQVNALARRWRTPAD